MFTLGIALRNVSGLRARSGALVFTLTNFKARFGALMFTISSWTFTESVSCGFCETDLGGNNLEEVVSQSELFGEWLSAQSSL